MSKNRRRRVQTAAEMVHPAVAQSRFGGVLDGIQQDRELLTDSMRGVGASVQLRQWPQQVQDSPVDPAHARRDLPIAERMAAAERGEMAYDAGSGEGATPVYVRDYQREGRDVGAGYLNNPFDEEGRERIGQQFWEAPLGGHIRGALEGQELLGYRINGGQARIAEQALAGLTAVGVGVPAFMAAVQNLSTPQDQNIIPL